MTEVAQPNPALGCEPVCPICDCPTLMEGDFVDVGVGQIKCSPDVCPWCGYVQPSGYPHYDGVDDIPSYFAYLRKCWELQVWPWKELAKRRKK